jgi:3D (Asp-Asp-Asp) domain-containing protein
MMGYLGKSRSTKCLSSGLFIIALTAGGLVVRNQSALADAGADHSSDNAVSSAVVLSKPVGKFLSGTSDLIEFEATAYCIRGRTASGAPAQTGVIAADTRLLPLGTIVHIQAGKYSGTYTVLDTGARLKGHKIDIFVPTRREAIRFGRRPVKLKILGRIRSNPNCGSLLCAQP